MSWFQVDDRFWSHPKTIGISMSAAGVWVMAGAWCMEYLTDGYIPDDALVTVCRRRVPREAQELANRNLWTPVGDGWQFVDWLQWQVSRKEIEAKRAATKARQERWRQKRQAGES